MINSKNKRKKNRRKKESWKNKRGKKKEREKEKRMKKKEKKEIDVLLRERQRKKNSKNLLWRGKRRTHAKVVVVLCVEWGIIGLGVVIVRFIGCVQSVTRSLGRRGGSPNMRILTKCSKNKCNFVKKSETL